MAIENTGKFRCPNCGGDNFEIDELNVCNSHFKPYVVKCGACFTVIGPVSNSEFLLSSKTDSEALRRYSKAP
jgi:predicted RNA-binding Zn-ribbon protein involved in translation (DUF1610 family)